MLETLDYTIRIGSTPTFLYFDLYLSDRYQMVCTDSQLSEPLPINSGVPQGSILGPTLFLLFINDLPLVLQNNIGLYVDDSTLYAFGPTISEVEEKLRLDLDEVSKWVNDNKMRLNKKKTKYATISTRQKLANSTIQNLDLILDGQQQIKVQSGRILGVHSDNHLTWTI